MKSLSKILFLSITIFSLIGINTSAFSHHSTSGINTEKLIRIEGTISKFRWTNPHASFKLEGSIDNSPSSLWTIEMTAPNVLKNAGWKRSSLKPGDKVVVFANPTIAERTLKDGSQGGLYVGVILADGTTLGRTDGKLTHAQN